MNRVKKGTIAILERILSDGVKRSLFHLSFHLAREEFDRFAHTYNFAPDMKMGLVEMASRGFAPRTIIDVGAFAGEWSKAAKRIWPASQLVMIEPNLAEGGNVVDVAEKLDALLFGELLGAHDDRATQFNIMGSGSSVLPECSAVPRRVETRRMRRLDSLLKSVLAPALLKIDAQGYELEILKGATAILPAIEAILLEIAIIEINVGAPLLHDVVGVMKNLGFVVYDVLEIHRRPLDGALNQIDFIFVRERSALIADKRHFA
jgi:FkbM family methyltransferase